MEKKREIPFNTSQRNGRRVILFPSQFQGHLTPMLQLADILYRKGFSINIIHTLLNSPNPSSYPHFIFHLMPVHQPPMDDGDIVAHVEQLNINYVNPFRGCLANLISTSSGMEDDPVACLITDSMWHFTQAVADSFKLPRLVLRTSSAFSFLCFAALPVLREKGFLPIQDSQLELQVEELAPLKVKDLPVIKTHNPESFYQSGSRMAKVTKNSSGLILNSCEELEQVPLCQCRQNLSIPIFPIGLFSSILVSPEKASLSSLLAQDHSAILWLDNQAPRSVVYVSFGSIAAINESEFLEMAWGLANSKHPFLWVVRPGLVDGSDQIASLPDGFMEIVGGLGHIVKWAPQQQVLAHPATAAFWTHSGWNSTLESICAGVPMICQPNFGDQRINARYVSDVWKVGVHLEYKVERKEMERAIRRVMVDAEGDLIRKRIQFLKKKVNLCTQETGSSSRSLNNLVDYILSL